MSKILYHHLNLDEVLKNLDTTPDGLSDKEAKIRLEKYGTNTIKNVHHRSKFWRFIDQFKDLMVGVLLIAAVASLVISIMNNESFVDSIIIIAIVILNAVLGFLITLGMSLYIF